MIDINDEGLIVVVPGLAVFAGDELQDIIPKSAREGQEGEHFGSCTTGFFMWKLYSLEATVCNKLVSHQPTQKFLTHLPNLCLTNLALVVLVACRTALGITLVVLSPL